MKRSRIALVLLGLLVGGLLAATSAVGEHPRAKIVRWDLVEIANGTAVAGGVNVATDPASGESLIITGSGILKVKVRSLAERAPPEEAVTALLEVHCHPPETVEDTFEGVRITVDGQVFEPDPDRHGVTLFHVM